MKNLAIIGAGACGLMLAASLKNENINITIYNKGKIGRKILASGNGKCNISNASYDESKYHNNPLALDVLSHQSQLFDLYNKLGIYTKSDNEGRMYPISESSQSVLNILLDNINAKFIDLEVNDIKYINNKYIIDNTKYDYVVIATGSNASFKDDYNYSLLNNLNLDINEFKPSLVGFKVKNKIKEISGVRAKCLATLCLNDKKISEQGEVIFKDDGISGICIMNLSSYYQNNNHDNAYITLDLAHGYDYKNLQSVLAPKLYNYYLNNKFDVHSFKLDIKDTYDYEFAQVCKGGININCVNSTLELKNHKNIYVGGEILDVDGLCGGYNLMFAFCCALRIKRSILNEDSNK